MAIKRSGRKNTSSKQKNSFKTKSFNPLKSIKSPILRILSKVILYFVGISLFWVISLRFINPPITWLMIQRGFLLKEQGKGFKLEKNWLNYDELSDNLKRAATTSSKERCTVTRGSAPGSRVVLRTWTGLPWYGHSARGARNS